MFELTFSESAAEDLRAVKKSDQKKILAAIQEQLTAEPVKETRNRKPLRPNSLAQWEIRVGEFRVFYDVAEKEKEITIKAVGWKEHNKLYFRGKEGKL